MAVRVADLKALGHNSADTIHYSVEAVKLAKPQKRDVPMCRH